MQRKTVSGAPKARNVQPKRHDTYQARRKPGEVVVCDDCRLVFHGGRWQAIEAPLADQSAGVCPACQRVRDRYPAGTVRLQGMPLGDREEILGMIRNVEQRERHEHPLERLMEVEDGEDALVVTTTGMHLARCIAGALRRRYHGAVAVRYPEGDGAVQVDWLRSR